MKSLVGVIFSLNLKEGRHNSIKQNDDHYFSDDKLTLFFTFWSSGRVLARFLKPLSDLEFGVPGPLLVLPLEAIDGEGE